jgi:microcystin-dependent protein
MKLFLFLLLFTFNLYAQQMSVPVGTVLPFLGATPPTGYLFANGACVSATTYKSLCTLIGTTYGTSCGAGQCNLPNFSGVGAGGLIGSIRYAGVVNCSWLSSSTSLSNFSADTDCNTPTTTGQGLAPSTKVPAIVFNYLPAGEYYIVATGYFGLNASTNNAGTYFRFSDGTNSTSAQPGGALPTSTTNQYSNTVVGRLNYSTLQTNVTINLQGKTSNAANSVVAVADVNSDFEISVYYYPKSNSIIKF